MGLLTPARPIAHHSVITDQKVADGYEAWTSAQVTQHCTQYSTVYSVQCTVYWPYIFFFFIAPALALAHILAHLWGTYLPLRASIQGVYSKHVLQTNCLKAICIPYIYIPG